MVEEQIKRRWQNLLYKRCPNCGTEMEVSGLYIVCPKPHKTEQGRNCFFIKKERAVELLLDTTHPANLCLTVDEKEHLEELIRKF